MKHPPENHQYTLHITYTGEHCALCGQPEDKHETTKNVSFPDKGSSGEKAQTA